MACRFNFFNGVSLHRLKTILINKIKYNIDNHYQLQQSLASRKKLSSKIRAETVADYGNVPFVGNDAKLVNMGRLQKLDLFIYKRISGQNYYIFLHIDIFTVNQDTMNMSLFYRNIKNTGTLL